MASPCAIEREQLLQLRSGYNATKTISLSVLWVCVQKTSEKIVDLVCCQDLCAKRERSVQLLVAVKGFGGSLRKFSREKILVHQRVLKESGLSQTKIEEKALFSW